MVWLARVLAGPVLWAGLFSAVYALHGAGCHLGWTSVPIGPTDLHHTAMWLVWGGGLVLHLGLVVLMPRGMAPTRSRWIVVAGTWIGLVASAFTLMPVVATSTCF